jgi:hypothetical protein
MDVLPICSIPNTLSLRNVCNNISFSVLKMLIHSLQYGTISIGKSRPNSLVDKSFIFFCIVVSVVSVFSGIVSVFTIYKITIFSCVIFSPPLFVQLRFNLGCPFTKLHRRLTKLIEPFYCLLRELECHLPAFYGLQHLCNEFIP